MPDKLLGSRERMSSGLAPTGATKAGYIYVSPTLIPKAKTSCNTGGVHIFSRSLVDQYQNILVGDVSSPKLVRTRMAKSVLDSGWGMLRNFLQYKGEHAGRTVRIVNERNTTRACSGCGALNGPTGPGSLVVRRWVCAACGEAHDRDVNAARNILTVGLRGRASVGGNESLDCVRPPSQIIPLREAGSGARKTAA
jgi:IS605 OrfB family transposase